MSLGNGFEGRGRRGSYRRHRRGGGQLCIVESTGAIEAYVRGSLDMESTNACQRTNENPLAHPPLDSKWHQ